MKRATHISANIPQPQKAIKIELDRIFDEISSAKDVRHEDPGKLTLITLAACSLIADRLGTEPINVIAANPQSGQIANNLITSITSLLDNHGVYSVGALDVFPSIFLTIKNHGTEPRDNFLESLFEQKAFIWFRRKVIEEIYSLTMSDKLAEIERRLHAVECFDEVSYRSYKGALKSLKEDLEREIEIETRRKETANKLALNIDKDLDNSNIEDRFTRKQTIYLLQELIPDFKLADNTKKAEFITKITGYKSTKNIADEFSNIRHFADPDLLARWKDKLKTTGRGRKRNNP